MTFVGKILVFLIMGFSLVFLGVSTVVFTTAKNWKGESASLTTKLADVQKKLDVAKANLTTSEGQLKSAQDEHSKQIKERETRIVSLETQVKDANAEMTAARLQLETAQKNAQVALGEATARKGEIEVLADTQSKAQTQANQFNAQNIELQDQIRVLQREKATAEENNKSLRGYVAKATAYFRKNGISSETVDKMDGTMVPPAVEGKVTELNATKRTMEISIGSDDGLKAGQELYVFRFVPRSEYIGKVKIISTNPDKAVAEVIGATVSGKKVQEGDIVSSTFFHSR